MLDKKTLEKLGGWSGYRLERVVWPEAPAGTVELYLKPTSKVMLRIPTKLTARSDDRDRSPHPFFTGGVFVSRSVTMGQ